MSAVYAVLGRDYLPDDFHPSCPEWLDHMATESVIYIMIAATMLGLPLVQNLRGHMNLGLLPRMLRRGVKAASGCRSSANARRTSWDALLRLRFVVRMLGLVRGARHPLEPQTLNTLRRSCHWLCGLRSETRCGFRSHSFAQPCESKSRSALVQRLNLATL